MRDQDFRHSRRRDFDADTYNPQPRAFGTRPWFNQAPFEAPSGPPVSGVVKWFSPEKGFGFVELSDGSGDAFLHGSVLVQSGIGAVQPGDTLEVRVGPGHKGPHVAEVLSLDSSTAVPSASRQRSSPQAATSNASSVEMTGTAVLSRQSGEPGLRQANLPGQPDLPVIEIRAMSFGGRVKVVRPRRSRWRDAFSRRRS